MKQTLKILLLLVLVYSVVVSYKSGVKYGDALVTEMDANIKILKDDFKNGKEIYCANTVISIKNNWSYNSEKDTFVSTDKYYEVKDCLPKASNIAFWEIVKSSMKFQ